MSKSILFIFAIIFCALDSIGQVECKRIHSVFKYDTANKVYRGDKILDSILKKNHEIELFFHGSIQGKYRLVFNDSVYFSGRITENPYSGYSNNTLNLTSHEGDNNIMIFENLDNGLITSFQLTTKYLHVVLGLWASECQLFVEYRNKRALGR